MVHHHSYIRKELIKPPSRPAQQAHTTTTTYSQQKHAVSNIATASLYIHEIKHTQPKPAGSRHRRHKLITRQQWSHQQYPRWHLRRRRYINVSCHNRVLKSDYPLSALLYHRFTTHTKNALRYYISTPTMAFRYHLYTISIHFTGNQHWPMC